MKEILLVTPPFTQLNTPYPATAYLKGFLNTKGIASHQMDLGIEVILALFSKSGLRAVFDQNPKDTWSENAQRIFALRQGYMQTVDSVISFLQGQQPTLARQICAGGFLPEASRFHVLAEDDEGLQWAFGLMGLQDKAKHLATLYLEDLSDFIVETLDPNFGFSRYAEQLGRSANSFDVLYEALHQPDSLIDQLALQIFKEKIEDIAPKIVCLSVPFPGNLFSAFRMGKFVKTYFPEIKVAMGGGFPNTELRSLTDPRVFEFLDYITLDDGELPVELLYEAVCKGGQSYKRTFLCKDQKVVYVNDSLRSDYKQKDVGTPDYSDLKLHAYISVIEIANPMHSLWSDGRWNKLTMAHGCYWGKCTFCDISLDYIKLYEPITAKLLVDRMEVLMAQTGTHGFHFVDEAAPPALMRELALEILRRGLVVTWWTNIRFEKSFTADLCKLLKASGCIAVSGGLEVASDRLLDLIQKGVTVAQVARVTQAFTASGIMVHAYLMYGYPTQTVQETIDSLEMVRQLFALGVLQSAFWHQFAMTAHSPVGLSPSDFGVIPKEVPVSFAHNDVDFVDRTGIDHSKFSFGLKKALFNYMHGLCFDFSLQEWFDFKVPRTTVAPDYIENCLTSATSFVIKPNAKVFWIGNIPSIAYVIQKKKGKVFDNIILKCHSNDQEETLVFDKPVGLWLYAILEKCSVSSGMLPLSEVKRMYALDFDDFEIFWFSKPMQKLKEIGLLVL